MDLNNIILPSSFYVHIPFCISKCRYCDFFSKTCYGKYIPDAYIDALVREIDMYFLNLKNMCHNAEPVLIDSIYIGGGTPSLLNEKQIEKITQVFCRNGVKSSRFEFTFEVNPDDVNEKLLSLLNACGITRISCGIQSLNQKVLDYTGRRADIGQNLYALDLLSKKWKGDFSADLISGLPYENKDQFLENLKKVIEYNPSHISLYSLTIEDETPLGRDINSGLINYDYDAADEMWLSGRTLLVQKGYIQYEVSNFCKKNKESIHNCAYWQHKSYGGFGSGACGTVYDQRGKGVRLTNTSDIEKYIEYWTAKSDKDIKSEKISDVDNLSCLKILSHYSKEISVFEEIDEKTSKFEFFMMGLRKLSGVTDEEYFNCFKESVPKRIISTFEDWKKKGLLEINIEKKGKRYRLNEEGILFLNSLLELL